MIGWLGYGLRLRGQWREQRHTRQDRAGQHGESRHAFYEHEIPPEVEQLFTARDVLMPKTRTALRGVSHRSLRRSDASGKASARGLQQHAVVDARRRAKVRPIRRPQAMIERESSTSAATKATHPRAALACARTSTNPESLTKARLVAPNSSSAESPAGRVRRRSWDGRSGRRACERRSRRAAASSARAGRARPGYRRTCRARRASPAAAARRGSNRRRNA